MARKACDTSQADKLMGRGSRPAVPYRWSTDTAVGDEMSGMIGASYAKLRLHRLNLHLARYSDAQDPERVTRTGTQYLCGASVGQANMFNSATTRLTFTIGLAHHPPHQYPRHSA